MRRKLLFGSALLVGSLAVALLLYLTGGASATLAVSPPEDSAPLAAPSQRPSLPSHTKWKPYAVEEVVSVQLSRGPCYGECPVYGLVLRPDGTLKYDGGAFVKRLGGWTADFPSGQFVDLVNLLNQVNFSSLDDEYNSNATDLSTEVVSVTTQTGKKSVSQYGPSAPYGFKSVRDAMDKLMASAVNWTQVSPPPKVTPQSSGPPGDQE